MNIVSVGHGGITANIPTPQKDRERHIKNCGITIYSRELKDAKKYLMPGTFVIDKRNAIDLHGAKIAISTPMLDMDIPAGHYRHGFPESIELLDGKIPGGFDYIAPNLYVEMWRKFGAEIGEVNAEGKVIWN